MQCVSVCMHRATVRAAGHRHDSFSQWGLQAGQMNCMRVGRVWQGGVRCDAVWLREGLDLGRSYLCRGYRGDAFRRDLRVRDLLRVPYLSGKVAERSRSAAPAPQRHASPLARPPPFSIWLEGAGNEPSRCWRGHGCCGRPRWVVCGCAHPPSQPPCLPCPPPRAQLPPHRLACAAG